jgi:hypothetical protein
MKEEILFTPPLLANLLMAGLVMPSIEALACLLWVVLLVPTLPFPPTPFPPLPVPAIIILKLYEIFGIEFHLNVILSEKNWITNLIGSFLIQLKLK